MKADLLTWELAVLRRAVAFDNLSSAAGPIGLSQPQLSRIIAKLEKTLAIHLLDRQSRRQSRWTAAARSLAELCDETQNHFERRVREWQNQSAMTPERLSIGVLEGLMPIATELAEHSFSPLGISEVEIRVTDLDQLEEDFLGRRTDLIVTSRVPGRRKFKNQKRLGYQTLDPIEGSSPVRVYSSFEKIMMNPRPTRKNPILTSNSLWIREYWIRKNQGSGILPSRFHSGTPPKKEGVFPVLLIGDEGLPLALWQTLSTGVSSHAG